MACNGPIGDLINRTTQCRYGSAFFRLNQKPTKGLPLGEPFSSRALVATRFPMHFW